jgi:hypothetical protein
MGIRFDGKACADSLYLNLKQAMKELQQELLNEARQGMLTPEGAESLHDEEITDVAGVIVAAIVGGADAAMDEWGTGSMMDRNNPALTNYIGGELWNPQRMGHTVVGRPKGIYTNIYGEQVESSGKMEGLEIEYPRYDGNNAFVPHPPSHAIQTAARWMANGRMQSKIKGVIARFPFGKFIITDNK